MTKCLKYNAFKRNYLIFFFTELEGEVMLYKDKIPFSIQFTFGMKILKQQQKSTAKILLMRTK